MTTQTPTPTDNERLARLEGIVGEMNTAMNAGFERIHQELRSQRNNFLTALIITWASMLAGFIAIFIGILNVNA